MAKYALTRDLLLPNYMNFLDFQEFEESILADDEVDPVFRSKAVTFAASAAFRCLRTVGRKLGATEPYELPFLKDERVRVAVLIAPAFRRCPDFIIKGPKAAFLFDPCEPWMTHEQIVSFVDDLGLDVLFVPNPEFVEALAPLVKRCHIAYIPEGVAPEGYSHDTEKSLDILAFGRKYGPHHEALLKGLPDSVSYCHEFLDSRQDFIDTLAKARISICFPRSWADERLKTEMATMRYYQSMASKSLILGHVPDVLCELLGYHPGIEADLKDPVGQIEEILSNFEEYSDLLERNLKAVHEGQTYKHRWAQMKEILAKHLT